MSTSSTVIRRMRFVSKSRSQICRSNSFARTSRAISAGSRQTGTVVDEPEDGTEPALTVRFTVDASLEPEWHLVKDALPDPRPVRSGVRARFWSLSHR